jgi:hypothetical protein
MMISFSISKLLVLAPVLAFSAGQSPALSRDSAQISDWSGKTLTEIVPKSPGLKFVGSSAATFGGTWSNEIWVIGKAMRKPGAPYQYLVLTHPPKTEEQKSSVVTDAYVFAGPKGTDLFVHECFSGSKQVPVAAVAQINNRKIGTVIQALKADTVSGKLVVVEPKSVKCQTEQGTAE